VAREGLPYSILSASLALIAAWLAWWGIFFFFLLLTGFVVNFFRDPERRIPRGEGVIVAPADGKVIAIKETVEEDYLKRPALKVSIFMNVFDCHVNRAPMNGTIKEVAYFPGKFFAAHLDKASKENEHNCLVLESERGAKLLLVQIAGLIARRIRCWVKAGDRIGRGERFGLIQFGSRVDVYLPPEVNLNLRLGDRVRAGETVMGVLP
jgi:phosphatidylserine decarboxylase